MKQTVNLLLNVLTLAVVFLILCAWLGWTAHVAYKAAEIGWDLASW